jgi:hypothetical protein
MHSIRFNSKTTFTLYVFAAIAVVSVLIGGIDYSYARCGSSCSDRMVNNLSLVDISPGSSHITGACCCLNKSLCTVGNASTAYIFNNTSLKNQISKTDTHQLYNAVYGNNVKEILNQQIYRGRLKHFFIKKHPIYLQYSTLIC